MMGNTGTSSGPHFHFEIMKWNSQLGKWGDPFDPMIDGSYLNIGEFNTLDSTMFWQQGMMQGPLQSNGTF